MLCQPFLAFIWQEFYGDYIAVNPHVFSLNLLGCCQVWRWWGIWCFRHFPFHLARNLIWAIWGRKTMGDWKAEDCGRVQLSSIAVSRSHGSWVSYLGTWGSWGCSPACVKINSNMEPICQFLNWAFISALFVFPKDTFHHPVLLSQFRLHGRPLFHTDYHDNYSTMMFFNALMDWNGWKLPPLSLCGWMVVCIINPWLVP